MTDNTKYWMLVASKDHVVSGQQQGVAQACHGKSAALKRMQKGDFIIYYSSKQTMAGPEKCQKFTALGQVIGDDDYQVQILEDFCPARRRTNFLDTVEVSILPLIEDLTFIQNKKRWGYPFRFGFFEMNKKDFELISSKMLQNEKA